MSSLPLVQPCLFLGSCHHAWALSPNLHHPVYIQTSAHRVTTSDNRIPKGHPSWKRAGRQGRLKEYFCQATCRLTAGYEEGHTRVTTCSTFSHTSAELPDIAQMIYKAGGRRNLYQRKHKHFFNCNRNTLHCELHCVPWLGMGERKNSSLFPFGIHLGHWKVNCSIK